MAKLPTLLVLALVALTANAAPSGKHVSAQAKSTQRSTQTCSNEANGGEHCGDILSASPAASTSISGFARRAIRSRVMKRVGQDTAAVVAPWEAACVKAGGGDECNAIASAAARTLLAAANPCAQQDSADAMVDLANTLSNDAEMIRLARIFAQQPRNTPTSQAVSYCQKAPKNAELAGLFQCQFQSVDETNFVGGLTVGSPGTIPFGQDAPLSPPGSCAASPEGPIPDGFQLLDFLQEF
ncbi:hypothetical protein C8Q80DRAFT_1274114 [Daedaleopsis nitida]|nr:hypothetical protein C8Q80DRAFT_1274114 [Daedaleopsis nitida]